MKKSTKNFKIKRPSEKSLNLGPKMSLK